MIHKALQEDDSHITFVLEIVWFGCMTEVIVCTVNAIQSYVRLIGLLWP